ncbi:MAG: hypothetical protein HONBIEJF_00649 [Fimbriimonadaceae bacterium]|nr:hypothetical protein [Fimbriimonadaceae bacterium]
MNGQPSFHGAETETQVSCSFTLDEAWALVNRCIQSKESDCPVVKSAIEKLARAAAAKEVAAKPRPNLYRMLD